MQIKNNISEPLQKLELDKNRFRVETCPCGKSNKDGKFVPYKGYDNKGYCHSCGETFLPELPEKKFILKSKNNIKSKSVVKPQPKQISFIPIEIFKQSLKSYKANHFVKFLVDLFGVDKTNELISKYFIGTSEHWDGATVFWQIDIFGKIRTGKIMLYNPTTGKRVKEPRHCIDWIQSVLKLSDFELQQCLFGEHLLQDKTKPIAIVESEKTAIIASVYFPKLIWLAVGSITGLDAEKCSVLKGRNVVLFPDLNGFEKWSVKAKEFSHLARFTVSDLLESKAAEAERKQGLDLADYLIKFNYMDFANPETLINPKNEMLTKTNIENSSIIQPMVEEKFIELIETIHHFNKIENWDQEIIELELYFKSIVLPTQHLKLNTGPTILNVSKFIEGHLNFVKANNGKQTFLPYLNRLQELKQIVIVNLN